MRRLVVVDNLRPEWTTHVAEPGRWEFLLLGLERSAFEAGFRSVLAGLDWGYAAVAHLAEECHASVRDFCVALLPALREQGWAQEWGEAWWYLELVEKNAARGSWIEQLYHTALVTRAAAAYEDTWLQLESPQLARVLPFRQLLSPAASRQRTLPRMLASLLATAAANAVHWLRGRGRLAELHGQVVALTLYPDFWVAGRERFLPDFPGPWLAWLNRPARLLGRRLPAGLYPLQAALSAGDFLGLFHPRWLRSAWQLDRNPPFTGCQLAGCDVSPILQAELSRSLSGRGLFECLLLRAALERLLARVRPEILLYRLEFQGFENALLQASATRCPTVGYRHSVLSRWLLSHRFLPGELISGRPMPDVVWVPSEHVGALMVREGFPPARVVVCGPQRQANLKPAPAASTRRRVLVALGLRRLENAALLEAVSRVRAANPALEWSVRPHPAAPGAPLEQADMPAAEGPLTEVLQDCLAVVTPGSTLAFEAMALGVMPVIYEEPTTFCAYSLAEFGDALWVVQDSGGLRQALEAIATNAPECSRRRACWPAAVAAALGDLHTPLEVQRRRALETTRKVLSERGRDPSPGAL